MNASQQTNNTNLATIDRAYAIQFERSTASTPEAVWDAITTPSVVSKWMGYPAKIELRIGGDYFLDFGADSEENLDGVIIALEPKRLLRYAWGLSVLEWTLEADDASGGCRYGFQHFGMPVLGVENEEGVAAGWHSWLDSLEANLHGTARSKDEDRECCAAVGPYYRRAIENAIGSL